MRMHHRQIVTSLMLVVALTRSAMAQDWPQWRGPDRTGAVEGVRLQVGLQIFRQEIAADRGHRVVDPVKVLLVVNPKVLVGVNLHRSGLNQRLPGHAEPHYFLRYESDRLYAS